MIKPRKLLPGDKVATVSPSSGSAGEPAFRWRYEIGVRRLKELFGFDVVAMPNSLKGIEYNSKHRRAGLRISWPPSAINR